MEDWTSFDAFVLDARTGGNSLVTVGMHFLPKVSFPSCTVDPVAFRGFLEELQAAYGDLPYHNRVHAADVAQACMWLAGVDREQSGLLLLAALVHDCGHFGLTNDNLRLTNHVLVQKHGTQSPLEKYHLEISTLLIHKHKLCPITAFTDVIEPTLRRLVLCTDPQSPLPSADDFEGLVIRAADVSALARNLERGLLWGKRLHLELGAQTEEENWRTSSLVFAKETVLPLFILLAQKATATKVQPVVELLRSKLL